MVTDHVLTEVLSTFAETVAGEFTTGEVLRQLGEGAVRVLGVDGAGVMVPHGAGLLRFAFATGPSEHAVTALERLQERLQTGPCGDSHQSQTAIDIADLAAEGSWPAFQRQAVDVGLRAVTALPLLARGRSWGVLDLYRAERGRLTPRELHAARTLAQVATSYLVVAADRDAAREAQAELAHRAMYDPLTGLPVRWVFLEQLTHALDRLARHPGLVGVLFADLDGLKYVNDTYGHDAGDRLLRTCVERVRAAVRPSDIVARLGGDEFVVLLEDLVDATAATAVARRILAELALPYRPDGEVLQPSASLGLALTDDSTMSAAALVTHADSAMYRAKRAGRGRYELFDAASHAADRAQATARHDTTAALRTAIRDGQLRLHYQPIIDLTRAYGHLASATPRTTPDATAGEGAPLAAWDPRAVYAVEALARWQHPTRGLLSAEQFIPDAESAGLMRELGAWVLAAACRQLGAWDEALGGRSPARLFINISTDELTSPELPKQLAAELRANGIAPDRVTLEVTETGLIADFAAARRTLAALEELGCEMAIDDVGTGYSSLSRLVDLPAATWKIDRSFTGHLSTRPTAGAVVSAVLQMGGTLNRTVVVEGVETHDVVQALRRLGCTHAQGYYLGAPQDPEQFSQQLATTPA